MDITYPLTIYYDASCPLCKSEMETLKETDFDNQLILINCADVNITVPASCPVSREAMMERIYAVDANGVWINSVDVFAASYDASGHKMLANIWANKRLRPILSRAYPLVADNRQWLSKTPLPRLLNRALRFSARKML